MDKHNWQLIEQLFGEAHELPREQWESYLREASQGNEDLFQQVLALLQDFEPACDFFEELSGDLFTDDSLNGPLAPGLLLGPYLIEKEIGRGGMSVVYQASRADGAYEEHVAVKVLRKGLDTDNTLRRFRDEKQLLVNLRHPGIANLLDAGETEQGQPYLVMEYIEGINILEAVKQQQLNIPARLKLFQQVLEAVQHAHKQLVVHRDIKPANILVNGQGEVKLLDFGIAKLLDPSLANPTLTQQDQRILTPLYAAPEQKTGQAISTATDIYQLGLLLHELLTEGKSLEAGSSDTLPYPSSLVHDPNLKKQIRGDLDLITAMALRPEPSRRYDSAVEMARDIEAYFLDQPVQARPESRAYLLHKFYQRNRLGVWAAMIILLALVGGIVATSWQSIQTQRALERETQARQKAERITAFLFYLFESADPYVRQDGISTKDLTLEDFLDQSLPIIREDLKDQPEEQLELLEIMSELYSRLDQNSKSEALALEVLQLTEEAFGTDDPQYADRIQVLASSVQGQGRYAEADLLYQLALPASRAAYGMKPMHLSVVYNDYGLLKFNQGEITLADSLYGEAIRIMRFNGIPDTANYATTLASRSQAKKSLGAIDTAYQLAYESLSVLSNTALQQSIFAAHAHNRLAEMLTIMDSLEAALIHQEKASQGFETFLGPESHFYALSLYNQAKILDKLGQHVQQAENIRQSMRILAQLYGNQNRNYGKCMIALAGALRKQRLFTHAADTLRDVQKMAEQIDLPWLKVEALLEQSHLELDQSQADFAIRTVKQAQDLMAERANDNKLYLGLADLRLTQAYGQKGELSLAKSSWEQARSHFASLPASHPYVVELERTAKSILGNEGSP